MVLREICPTGVKYLGTMKIAKSFGGIWNCVKRTVPFDTLGGGWKNV